MRFATQRFLLAVAGVLWFSSAAAADDTSDCIAASEAAQSLRDQHLLLEARDKLAVCSRDVCPGPVRVDCIEERAKVDAAMPSVVLQARDRHGNDSADVRVLCDGSPFTTQLDGKAQAVNPGPHAFRFEVGDSPPVERRVVIGEGEKNRLVSIELGPRSADDDAAAAGVAPASAARRRAIVGWIIGGIGVAATIPMAALWISGTSDIQQMRGSCAPAAGGSGCSASRIDSDRARLVAGDVLLGVAVAATATGAVLVLVHPAESKPEHDAALRLGAAPTQGGAFVSAAARF